VRRSKGYDVERSNWNEGNRLPESSKSDNTGDRVEKLDKGRKKT
jgi:hypothetical protein